MHIFESSYNVMSGVFVLLKSLLSLSKVRVNIYVVEFWKYIYSIAMFKNISYQSTISDIITSNIFYGSYPIRYFLRIEFLMF